MVQEVHLDQGDLEFLELRGGLESLGNLHIAWRLGQQRGGHQRALGQLFQKCLGPVKRNLWKEVLCWLKSMLEGHPFSWDNFWVYSLCHRGSLGLLLEEGTPHAVCFNKDYKQFTSEILLSWGSIWRSFIDLSSNIHNFPKFYPFAFVSLVYWKNVSYREGAVQWTEE